MLESAARQSATDLVSDFKFTEVASGAVQTHSPLEFTESASTRIPPTMMPPHRRLSEIARDEFPAPVTLLISGRRSVSGGINVWEHPVQFLRDDFLLLGGASSSPDEYRFLVSPKRDAAIAVQVIRRIGELRTAFREDEGRDLSEASVGNLLSFLDDNPSLRIPGIVATPSGNLLAEWRQGPGRLLSMHFLPDKSIRFVVFAPNPRRRGITIRLSGTADVDSVLAVVEPHGVMEWAVLAGR